MPQPQRAVLRVQLADPGGGRVELGWLVEEQRVVGTRVSLARRAGAAREERRADRGERGCQSRGEDRRVGVVADDVRVVSRHEEGLGEEDDAVRRVVPVGHRSHAAVGVAAALEGLSEPRAHRRHRRVRPANPVDACRGDALFSPNVSNRSGWASALSREGRGGGLYDDERGGAPGFSQRRGGGGPHVHEGGARRRIVCVSENKRALKMRALGACAGGERGLRKENENEKKENSRVFILPKALSDARLRCDTCETKRSAGFRSTVRTVSGVSSMARVALQRKPSRVAFRAGGAAPFRHAPPRSSHASESSRSRQPWP